MACNLRTLSFRGEYSHSDSGRSWRGEQLYLNQESQVPWEGRFLESLISDSRLVGTFRKMRGTNQGTVAKKKWGWQETVTMGRKVRDPKSPPAL